jgi:hypothetical protein
MAWCQLPTWSEQMEHCWEVRVAAPNLASLTTPAVSIVSRALLSFT